jgi:aryl-alcohol dehydrogenase-like predicted oxidoreductase
MQTRTLGNSDLDITLVGFGAWAIGGGDWFAGWGAQDDQESIDTIRRAIDMGMNWIDTAAVYGLGRSEAVVGEAIKGMANKPYIFTKCSRVQGPDGKGMGVLKADSIRKECEASLKRLGVEVIDLYQIHWPQPQEDLEEGWQTLADLQKEGKVRYIGVSNFNVEQLKRAQAIAPVTSLQPPYSMIRRDIEAEILPFCEANNIGVIVYSPMASGLLTGAMTRERAENLPEDDWRSRSAEFQEPRLSRNLALVEILQEIGKEHGRTPGEIAIAWTLKHSAVTAAIVGARRPDQIDGIIHGGEVDLSTADMVRIADFLTANP